MEDLGSTDATIGIEERPKQCEHLYSKQKMLSSIAYPCYHVYANKMHDLISARVFEFWDFS